MFRKHILPTSISLLIVLAATLLGVTPSVEAQEVHALLIIMDNDPPNKPEPDSDIPDSDFNISVRQNLWNLEDMLDALDVTPEAWQASQRVFQATEIISWVQNLKVQSEDTVLVYYSGHGRITDNKHFLALDPKDTALSLVRSDLATAVSEKSCRLKMLITDTCSDFTETEGLTPESALIVPKDKAMQNLFFEHRGFLDITAAAPGERAWGNTKIGGYFTQAFTTSNTPEANADQHDFISWEEVFNLAREKTKEYFNKTRFSPSQQRLLNKTGQKTQTPIAHELPAPINSDSGGGSGQSPPPTPIAAILNFTSTPSGAEVMIDGFVIGQTPLANYELQTNGQTAKDIEVTVKAAGYEDSIKKFRVRQGKPFDWEFELTKKAGSIPIIARTNTEKMALIPPGKFRMGTDRFVNNDSKPIHTVDLDAFYIDKYEVTVGEYKQFLQESGYQGRLHSKLSEFSPTDNHPIVGISWHDAMAYAQWVNKRLPTEAEWEKAARGGLMDMDYPWGNDEIDSSKANYGNMHGRTMPVGSYAPNAFGLYDMVGNVREWCLDPWDSNFYANSPPKNPFAGHKSRNETISDYKTVRGLRVTRGGSWHQQAPYVAGRFKYDSMKRAYMNIGFRCAKDAPR